jgi:hypothetical protein
MQVEELYTQASRLAADADLARSGARRRGELKREFRPDK